MWRPMAERALEILDKFDYEAVTRVLSAFIKMKITDQTFVRPLENRSKFFLMRAQAIRPL